MVEYTWILNKLMYKLLFKGSSTIHDITILSIEDEFCPFDNPRKKYDMVF